MKGAFWHIVQTFVGSLIIILSALVVRFTGFVAIDPILGMAFGLVLFWASWSIIRSALHILLQSTPEGLDIKGVIATLEGIDGVEDVHHVHAWNLASGRNLFSAHIRVRSLAHDGERVLRGASDALTGCTSRPCKSRKSACRPRRARAISTSPSDMSRMRQATRRPPGANASTVP